MKTIEGKLIVLGHQGVGKSSTIIHHTNDSLAKPITATVAPSMLQCKILIDNITVKLQIWDTAGQERFKAMAPMFYRNANAALFVFDITSVKSFISMQSWVLELKRNVENPMVLCVVGNKIDLDKNRQVSRDEAIRYARSIDATYHECCAMQNQGVDKILDDVARGLIRLSESNLEHNLKVYDPQNIDNKRTDVNLGLNVVVKHNTVHSRCC